MVLELKLIELAIVKAAEFRRQAAERPNQSEYRCYPVHTYAETRLFCKREAGFGFAL